MNLWYCMHARREISQYFFVTEKKLSHIRNTYPFSRSFHYCVSIRLPQLNCVVFKSIPMSRTNPYENAVPSEVWRTTTVETEEASHVPFPPLPLLAEFL